MKIIKLWDNTKTYMYPNSSIASPERVMEDFPAITVFPHIIETDENEQVIFAIENLAAMRSRYNIEAGLSEEEAIAQIQEIVNTPAPVNTEPSAEERIAAALEFQVLASMEDVEEDVVVDEEV
jgi:predicted DNA-binding protein (UPF0251 family)